MMQAVPGLSITDEVLTTISSTRRECIMECLRSEGCHSVEIKLDLAENNCVLYGGVGTGLLVEPLVTPNSLTYSIYDIPDISQGICN